MLSALDNPTLQLAVVLLCIAAAAGWWIRRLVRFLKRPTHGCDSGCTGCGSSTRSAPLVTLDLASSGRPQP